MSPRPSRLRRMTTILLGLPVVLLGLAAIATVLIVWRIEARYPATGRFVDLEGGRLHYVEVKPKDRPADATVVLLHGASGNLADPLLAFGRRLSERYRVISVDRPGHGWSDRILGTDAATPAAQARLIAEGLRRLGIGPTVVVGHSLGGAVAARLALDHPDVAGTLLLIAPVTHPWPGGDISWYYHPAASLLGQLFTRTIATPAGLLLMEPTIRAVFAPQDPPPGGDYVEAARVPLALRPATFRANAQDVAMLYDAMTEQSRRYGELKLPTAVIAGDADPIVHTPTHAIPFAASVPGARLTVLPGIGHMLHHTNPDRVIAEIQRLASEIRHASTLGRAADAVTGRSDTARP